MDKSGFNKARSAADIRHAFLFNVQQNKPSPNIGEGLNIVLLRLRFRNLPRAPQNKHS